MKRRVFTGVALVALAAASFQTYAAGPVTPSYPQGAGSTPIIGWITGWFSDGDGPGVTDSGCAKPDAPKAGHSYQCVDIAPDHWLARNGTSMYCKGLIRDYGSGLECRRNSERHTSVVGETEAAKPVSIQNFVRDRFGKGATVYHTVQNDGHLILTVAIP